MSIDFPDLCALKAGNSTAWDVAFYHLWPIALRAAQHPQVCLLPWEAEDVASEAMLDLISRIQNVKSIDEIKALLATIAYRAAVSVARRKFAAKRCTPAGGEAQSDIASDFRSGLTDVERSEMTLLVREALAVLDAETRLLLLQRLESDLTYQEISAQHGIPLGTVCTKVARGLKKVRANLQESPRLLKELRDYLR